VVGVPEELAAGSFHTVRVTDAIGPDLLAGAGVGAEVVLAGDGDGGR